MPLRCVEERRSPTQLDEEEVDVDEDCLCIWQDAPDSILLHIFSFLSPQELCLTAQICKKWTRISYDESLWRSILRGLLKDPECNLAEGKASWKSEVIRILYHTPTVLTESLHEHTDEVLHISFSHDGTLFSTTSKDATLKVWTVGNQTSLKYSKDFRELLGWDFTQYSCFNESDTIVLVSSVKTSSYMDRRGFMAILSLVNDFEILRVVTMDPSQLFGAWLDDTTFLGGSLEISLDRFATTVQIVAYDDPEKFTAVPRSSPTPVVEESAGQPMFTFSSETASLIKFLTVAEILTDDSDEDCSPSSCRSETRGSHLAELSPSRHSCKENQSCCSYSGLSPTSFHSSSYRDKSPGSQSLDHKPDLISTEIPGCSYALRCSTHDYKKPDTESIDKNNEFSIDCSIKETDSISTETGSVKPRNECNKVLSDYEIHRHLEPSCTHNVICDNCKASFRIQGEARDMYVCDKCKGEILSSVSADLASDNERHKRLEHKFDDHADHSELLACEDKLDYMGADLEVKMDCDAGAKSKHSHRPGTLNVPPGWDSHNRPKAKKHYRDTVDTDKQLFECSLDSDKQNSECSRSTDNQYSFSECSRDNDSIKTQGSGSKVKQSKRKKNLIFVTGEFAVALHQLGFKNVAPYTQESVLTRGITPMDEDNPEGFMVVNYSNNDIHIVRRQQETDKPDNLIDLFGHVTGLCLTVDQRYLFINCRPWIGEVDRSDPWATPDLSPNIEVRIIDLLNLKDLGVRYVGHKGFSPSNMCCFVFLDVSHDYVASGSEDSKGYLWDRHYRSLLANYEHDVGVVNAVGFNPKNQEYFVTVSDDGLVKIWRSKHEVKRLNL